MYAKKPQLSDIVSQLESRWSQSPKPIYTLLTAFSHRLPDVAHSPNHEEPSRNHALDTKAKKTDLPYNKEYHRDNLLFLVRYYENGGEEPAPVESRWIMDGKILDSETRRPSIRRSRLRFGKPTASRTALRWQKRRRQSRTCDDRSKSWKWKRRT